MPSDDDSDLQTRRKRALLVAGAIGVAAIAWNANDWWDDDHVRVEVSDREEAREVAREVRDEVRESVREARGEARAAGEDASRRSGDADLPRITEEGGVLRVESGDGRSVTISIDEDAADEEEPPADTPAE